MSTGGDELNEECYVQDPQTQADLQTSGQTLEEALSTFLQIIHGALREGGKTPVVWEGKWTCTILSIAFTFVCRDGATTQRHAGKRYGCHVREICTSSISFTFSCVL